MVMSDDEKRWRRLQRKADAINAKTQAEVPLFADMEHKTNATEQYWRWRYQVAGGVEGTTELYTLQRPLDSLRYYTLQRIAAGVFADQMVEIDVRLREIYPNVLYWMSILEGMVCGTDQIEWYRLEFDPTKVNRYNPDGRRCVVDRTIPGPDFKPPFTREQLKAKLALPEMLPAPDVDLRTRFEQIFGRPP